MRSKLFFLIFLILSTSFSIPSVDAADWLTGWSYRKSFTITGSVGGGDQTNYQIGVKVYYGAGVDGTETVTGITFGKVYTDSKCETDFGDIIFTADDGTNLLDFWIESQINSNYAIIWVEIPDLDDSPNTVEIYIYYGKTGESTTSSGFATFPKMFDHFPGVALNLTIWNVDVSDGSATVSGSIVRVQGNAGANRYSMSSKSPYEDEDPAALRFYAEVEGTSTSFQITQIGWSRWGVQLFGFIKSYHGSDRAETRDSLGNIEVDAIGGAYFDAWMIYELTRSGTVMTYRVDGVIAATGDANPDTDTIGANMYVRDSEYDIYCDWILIREWTDPEPLPTSWGAEESAPVAEEEEVTLNYVGIALALILFMIAFLFVRR